MKLKVARLGPEKRNMTKTLQETVEKVSHWIWVKREAPAGVSPGG